MATIFLQEAGDVIEWTAAADVSTNEFIAVGTKLGVALHDALSGEKVSVKVTGVIRALKDANAVDAGDTVNAVLATGVLQTASGTLDGVGICTEAAGAGATHVVARLNA